MCNIKDYILHKKGVLSEQECNNIITFFETHSELHYEGTIGGNSTAEYEEKKDTEIKCWSSDDYPYIFNHLGDCVSEYVKEYPHLNTVVLRWRIECEWKLQRYLPGEGYFREHCENGGPDLTGEGMDRRILAWMIYFNDVTDGGYTSFPSQNKKFQPRRGDVLIWPAYFTHPHYGIVSKTQTKYIATGWYSFT